ncbi:hypothetical protein PENTCL1PPCAC_10207, partial [Pristionchus entomophagus]
TPPVISTRYTLRPMLSACPCCVTSCSSVSALGSCSTPSVISTWYSLSVRRIREVDDQTAIESRTHRLPLSIYFVPEYGNNRITENHRLEPTRLGEIAS